jgi:predicted nucleotidyltransferase component of viral defense system
VKSPEQLKGAIRNIAEKKDIQAAAVLQMFLFERIIERLSNSPYKYQFILKGGLLISSLIGVDQRTTMDMDTTVIGLTVDEETMTRVISEFIRIDVHDGIDFTLAELKPIREADQYENFCATILADYGKIHATLKIDITTGDAITPREAVYTYPFMFEDKSVSVVAYPLETILAEKYETILRRNVTSTRARDLYDLFTLYKMKKDEVRIDVLREAIFKTADKRNSTEYLNQYEDVFKLMSEDSSQEKMWLAYQQKNSFAKEMLYQDVIKTILAIGIRTNK